MPTLSDIGMTGQSPFERSIQRMADGLSAVRQGVQGLQNDVASTQRVLQSASTQIGGVISSIESGMGGLKSVMEQVLGVLQNIRSGGGGGGGRARQQEQQMIHTIGELAKEYEKLGIDLKQYNVDLQNITLTEKQYNKVIQLAAEFNKERADSYEGMSARYKAMKIVYDKMTAAEQQGMTEMAAVLRQLYERMNVLQQATGKYQLQVGNYSKAMNGLHLATNQIVREMPTLANSMTQFVTAISNNVPIFLDAVDKIREQNKTLREAYETAQEAGASQKELEGILKGITPVWKGLVEVLKSYQTWVIVILTVLPSVIKNIKAKKKAKEEDAAATKELITVENALYKIYQEYANTASQNLVKLRLVYEASQDLTLSEQERLKAVRTLNAEFGETFKNFTNEEILLGRAKEAYDELTKSIERSALARAVYNKITEAQEQWIATEVEKKALQEHIDEVEKYEKELADVRAKIYQYSTDPASMLKSAKPILEYQKREEELIGLIGDATKRMGMSQEDAKKKLTEYDKDLREHEKAIQRIREFYKVEGLYDVYEDKGGKGLKRAKDSLGKVSDFYWEWREALVSGLDDSFYSQLERAKLSYEKQLANRKSQMDELQNIMDNARKVEAESREEEVRAIADANAAESATEKEAANKRAEEARKRASDAVSQFREAKVQMGYLSKTMLVEYENYLAERKKILKVDMDKWKAEVEDENFDTLKTIKAGLKLEKETRNKEAYETYNQMIADGNSLAFAKGELEKALRDSEIKYWEDFYDRLLKSGEITEELYNQIMSKLIDLRDKKIAEDKKHSRNKYRSFIDFIFARDQELGENDKYGMRIVKDEFRDMADGINTALKSTISYMKEWMSTRIEMAKIAVEKAKEQSDAAKSALDAEMEARANGYANNVQMARAEYEEKKRLENEAIREQERLEKLQAKIDEANQISSMVTAIANIWKGYTAKTPLLATILASAATATMLGSFAAAKIAAAQVTRAKTYGEGGVEYLDYGGSHASGHDIDFGVSKDGTRRRVERGEMVGVISKRSVAQYGVSAIADVINSLNGGTFDKQYGAALATLAWEGTDLSKVEKGIDTLVEQNGRKIVLSDGKTIEYYKNTKRIIHGR